MATIGSLVVSIRASVDEFMGDMKSIQKELEETAKYVKPLKESLMGIGEAMSAVGDVVAAGMFEITKKTAEYGAELERMHQRTGIATADLSVLSGAAKQAGIGFDTVQSAMTRFATAAQAATSGSGKQAAAFKDLGVSVTDANGAIRPAGDLIADITTKVAGMADGMQKEADMNALMGKSGANLIPMFNLLGKEGFDALKEKMASFGLVMDAVAAKNSEEFHQSLSTVEQAAEGLGATIGQQLMPIFTDLMQHISSVVVAVRDWVAVHPDITKAVLVLAAAIGGTGGLVLAVAGGIAALPMLTAAVTALMGPLGIAIAAVTAFTAAFMAFPGFRAVVLDVLKNIIDAVAIVGSELASVGTATIQLAEGHVKDAYNTMANSWTDAMTRMQQADDGFNNTISALSGKVQGFSTAEKQGAEATDLYTVANKKLDEAIKSLVESMEGESTKQLALSPAIHQAINDHVALQTIVDKTGKSVVDYLAVLGKTMSVLDPVLLKVAEATLDQEKWRTSINMTTDEILNLHLTFPQIQKLGEAFQKAYAEAQKASSDTLKQMQTDGDLAIAYWSKVYEAILNAQIKAENASQKAYDDVVKDAAANLRILSDIEKQALEEQVRNADERVKEIQKQTEANAAYILKTNKEVGAAAGHIFDDMFVKGQNVFTSLKNALKGGALSIGRTIFDDIVGYLGGPIKRAFDSFFEGLLEGTGIKNFLSGLGNKLGGLLGSIGLGTNSGGPDFVGPQVPDGTGMSGALKGGLITAGIGAAIAVGETLYKKFTELGRDKSTFVQQYQNPFGSNLGDIVDQFNAARLTGQLTVSDATTTLNSVKTLIGNFESNISDWMKKGGDYATVATRAQATMDANFGPNFSTLLASMQTNIDQRQGVIDDPVVVSTDANTTATNQLTDTMTGVASTVDNATASIVQWQATLLNPTMAPAGGGNTAGHNNSPFKAGALPPPDLTSTVSTVNAAVAHNGTLMGSVYLNAQQISDLTNSGGSYTASSGYNSIIPNASLSSVTGTYFSPGSVASMSADQLAALGISSHASGGPTRKGLSMLHDGEFVVPKGGALVKGGGGGGDVHVHIHTLDTKTLSDAMPRILPLIVNAVQNNWGGEGDRLRKAL